MKNRSNLRLMFFGVLQYLPLGIICPRIMARILLKLYTYEHKGRNVTSRLYFYLTYFKRDFMTSPSNWVSMNHEIPKT